MHPRWKLYQLHGLLPGLICTTFLHRFQILHRPKTCLDKRHQYAVNFFCHKAPLQKLKKAFWKGNQLMIDYAELELEGNSGT